MGIDHRLFSYTRNGGLSSFVRHGRETASVFFRSLVTQVSSTVSLLRSDDTDNEIYLIGTAHVSQSSADEVSQLIDMVKPQTVFIELDPARATRLIQENQDSMDEQFSFLKHMPLVMGAAGGQQEQIGEYIRRFYQMLKRYGFVPGIDMLSAIQSGERVKARLVYGDRDGNDTLRELGATFSFSNLMRGMMTPVPNSLQKMFSKSFAMAGNGSQNNMAETISNRVEEMKNREYAHEITDWMQRAFPDTHNVLLRKRDVHMSQQLHCQCSRDRKVVAVVGLAHMDGIEREWSRILEERKRIG